jgi:hypothetical protein
MAVSINDVIGTWNMVHDGWNGTLVIQGEDQVLHPVDGNCTFTSTTFFGTYTGPGADNVQVQGFLGGEDSNWQSSGCAQADHLVNFTVSFTSAPTQRFIGYVFTQTKNAMAGYTWWDGIPFGWYAQKQ